MSVVFFWNFSFFGCLGNSIYIKLLTRNFVFFVLFVNVVWNLLWKDENSGWSTSCFIYWSAPTSKVFFKNNYSRGNRLRWWFLLSAFIFWIFLFFFFKLNFSFNFEGGGGGGGGDFFFPSFSTIEWKEASEFYFEVMLLT